MSTSKPRRPRVKVPPRPPPDGEIELIPYPDDLSTVYFKSTPELWAHSVDRLTEEAVDHLAREVGADPAELRKVKHLLVEVVEEKPQGRPRITCEQYLEAASHWRFKQKPLKVACEMAGIRDPKTFRAAERSYRDWWKAYGEDVPSSPGSDAWSEVLQELFPDGVPKRFTRAQVRRIERRLDEKLARLRD